LCWAVFGQAPHENQSKTKHEESIVIACLDEGSTPSGSTKVKPSTKKVEGFLFYKLIIYSQNKQPTTVNLKNHHCRLICFLTIQALSLIHSCPQLCP
jgi:hypothetical protein